jgi:hypothetical protein
MVSFSISVLKNIVQLYYPVVRVCGVDPTSFSKIPKNSMKCVKIRSRTDSDNLGTVKKSKSSLTDNSADFHQNVVRFEPNLVTEYTSYIVYQELENSSCTMHISMFVTQTRRWVVKKNSSMDQHNK